MDTHHDAGNNLNLRLRLQGITKQYPGCLANDRINLAIEPGEIHALLGKTAPAKAP